MSLKHINQNIFNIPVFKFASENIDALIGTVMLDEQDYITYVGTWNSIFAISRTQSNRLPQAVFVFVLFFLSFFYCQQTHKIYAVCFELKVPINKNKQRK